MMLSSLLGCLLSLRAAGTGPRRVSPAPPGIRDEGPTNVERIRPVDTIAAPLDILKSRFGFDSFRGLQEEIIANVLARNDSLALMPTGAGKSLCYQLPALIFEGTTLVISPLIALMKDQVDALNANGIPARAINSSQSAWEIDQAQSEARQGQVKILYVAPEAAGPCLDFRAFFTAWT